MRPASSWKGANRLQPFLLQETSSDSQLDEKSMLRMKLLELEIELAEVSDELRCRMKQRIDAVTETDPAMQHCTEMRKELEFHDHVCGHSSEHNPEIQKVNICMVAMLKDFGGHEALGELIEIRNKLKGEIRKTMKVIQKLRQQHKPADPAAGEPFNNY